MRLASKDPFTFPLIDPNFLTSPFDQFAMVQAIKAARRFVQTPAWSDFVIDRFGDVGGAETDEEMLAAARRAIVTIWHPTCTARMSPANADWGVLDPQLRVKGVSGLRVVDASAFVRYFLLELSRMSNRCRSCSQSYLQHTRWRSSMSLPNVPRTLLSLPGTSEQPSLLLLGTLRRVLDSIA